jgi:LCP family protein required for cell wall assembly
LIVLLCSAATSAVFVSGEVQTLRKDLSQNPSLPVAPGQLDSAGWGDPQTLLLVGDDQRALTKYYHRAVPHLANEMLLVRIDPSKPYISMMSIPRELQVTISPQHGSPYTDRINSAYTHGIGVLVSTIKHALGLSVNHVMVVTFGRFKRAVDEMGCIYSTIDRRYYHVNVPGGEQYQEINLQPGYQDLCGEQALQFVSYRHGDTSLVRDARDQSFLLDVKKQYGPTLAGSVHKFEQIFGQAVQTDRGLHTTTGILNLIGTLISSSGRRVRQVQFHASLLPTYDTASPQQIAASVHAFLYGGSPLPTQPTARLAHTVHRQQAAASLALVSASSDELAQARSAAQGMPFPYEYPRVQDRGGSATAVDQRDYLIHAPDGSAYPIYDAVFSAGQLGQFYDVQGMTWGTAPESRSDGARRRAHVLPVLRRPEAEAGRVV